MDSHDARSPRRPLLIVWLLIELRVEAEDDMVPITMPVPILEGRTLDELRAKYAWNSRMIEARIQILYGTMWLSGRRWSIYGDRVITHSRARAMFPHDRFKAGFTIRSGEDPRTDELDNA